MKEKEDKYSKPETRDGARNALSSRPVRSVPFSSYHKKKLGYIPSVLSSSKSISGASLGNGCTSSAILDAFVMQMLDSLSLFGTGWVGYSGPVLLFRSKGRVRGHRSSSCRAYGC